MNKSLEIVARGTKIVSVGKHRKVVTVVEKYATGGDVVYLTLDQFNRPHDVSHKKLALGVERGDYEVMGGREREAA